MLLDIVGIGSQLGMDIFETPEGIKEFPGGSVANSLVALQCLGLKTGYIGLVGKDQYTEKILKDLTETGIDISRLRTVNSANPVCKIKITGGDRILADTGDRKRLDDFPEEDKAYLKGARAVFSRVSYLLTQEHAAFAKQNGLNVFLSLHNAKPGRDFGFLEGMEFDVLFCNKGEAKTIDKSRDRLIEKGAELVVTRGNKGFSIYNLSGKFDFPAYRVDSVDPTGAGDAFAAGYIYACLERWDLEKRAEFANAMGAMATLRYGARLKVKPETVFEFVRSHVS